MSIEVSLAPVRRRELNLPPGVLGWAIDRLMRFDPVHEWAWRKYGRTWMEPQRLPQGFTLDVQGDAVVLKYDGSPSWSSDLPSIQVVSPEPMSIIGGPYQFTEGQPGCAVVAEPETPHAEP